MILLILSAIIVFYRSGANNEVQGTIFGANTKTANIVAVFTIFPIRSLSGGGKVGAINVCLQTLELAGSNR